MEIEIGTELTNKAGEVEATKVDRGFWSFNGENYGEMGCVIQALLRCCDQRTPFKPVELDELPKVAHRAVLKFVRSPNFTVDLSTLQATEQEWRDIVAEVRGK